MHISIVIPVYNEQDNILLLANELVKLVPRFQALEILFVDDGSTDGTWESIKKIGHSHPPVRGFRFPRNQGQTSAMLHGLRMARGDALVTLDGDLQNNPEDIPRLVEKLDRVDVVCGYRAKRKDTWSRRIGSRLANRVRNWITHDGIRDTGCSLKAFRRECVQDLPPINGAHRFMPAYFKLNGRTIDEIPVDHRPRSHGLSKYTNWKRLPRGLLDLFGFWWYRKRFLPRMEMEEAKKS